MARRKDEPPTLPGLFDQDLNTLPAPVPQPGRAAAVRPGDLARDAALERVEKNADDAWKAEALHRLHVVALAQRLLTTDDVWSGLTTDTHEHKAIGAIMREGRRLGWIRNTFQQQVTNRAVANSRPVTIWESRICRTPIPREGQL